MSDLIFNISDEYENMDGWHKMQLRFRVQEGVHGYDEMELIESEGTSAFLDHPDYKKLEITEVGEDSVTFIIPLTYVMRNDASYHYEESHKHMPYTIRLGETKKFETVENCADSLPDIGFEIPYTLRYMLEITLVKESE